MVCVNHLQGAKHGTVMALSDCPKVAGSLQVAAATDRDLELFDELCASVNDTSQGSLCLLDTSPATSWDSHCGRSQKSELSYAGFAEQTHMQR